MHRFLTSWWIVALGGLLACQVRAAEFKMANGNVLKGEVASTDEDGLVVKLDVGGFSKREPWINFSQETLKELAQDPKVAPMVEPFIELEPEQIKAKEKQKEITVKPVPSRMERPAPRPGLAAAFLTPVGLALLAALMLGNLYAAYEVAFFRQQPVALVCGLSVLFPLLAPIIFLSLPTRVAHSEEAAPAGDAGAAASPGASKAKTTGAFPAAPAAGGLTLAAGAKAEPASAQTQPQTFTRGEFTFNRRFFETKFPGFFRMVPGEAEKDLVMVIKAVRGEYVGRRISRISMNEMHLQLQSGNASAEVMVPFVEIQSVQIRHKDAKV